MTEFRLKKGSELIQEYLLEQLRGGIYMPGDKLPSVEALAQQYAVGRSTIREALSALKAMGWLDIRHGGGTFVRKYEQTPSQQLQGWLTNVESVKSLIEVRKMIEVGSAGLAAKRRTSADLQAMAACLHRMEKHLEDEEASQHDDFLFHVLLAEASHNEVLIPMLQMFHQKCAEHMGETRRMWLFGERSSTTQLLEEHRRIYEAIDAQDDKLASHRMLEHLSKIEARLD